MHPMRKTWLACAAVLAAGLFAGTPARAAQIDGSLDVSATVPGACSISTTAVSFGDYTGLLLDAQGVISVNCTATLGYSVELGAGTGGGATRQMTKVGSPGTFLPYELYQDVNHTQPWGGTTAGYTANGATAKTALTGSGNLDPIDVFGRIEAGQTMSAGSFADTVTVSVIY